MSDHGRGPCRLDATLMSDRRAACSNHEDRRVIEILRRRIEDALAEGAGKSLFGAKQNERAFGMAAGAGNCRVDRQQAKRLADGARNDLGIGVDAGEQRSCALGARSRNAANCRYNRSKLADILDLRDDIGKAFGHHVASVFGGDWGASCDTRSESAFFN